MLGVSYQESSYQMVKQSPRFTKPPPHQIQVGRARRVLGWPGVRLRDHGKPTTIPGVVCVRPRATPVVQLYKKQITVAMPHML